MSRIISLVCSLALLLSAGCGDNEKLKNIGDKAAGTWKAVAEYGAEKKDQALALFGDKMKDLEGQWAKAKEKSADWSADAKVALDAKWKKVEAAYARTKDATGENWVKARDAFKAAHDEFKAELDK